MKLSSDVSILKSIQMGFSRLLSRWKISAYANMAQGSDQLYFSLHKIPGNLLRFRAIKLSECCCPFLFSPCNATLICLSLSL